MDDEFSQYVEQRLFGVTYPNKKSQNQQQNIQDDDEEDIPQWKKKIADLIIPQNWEAQKQIFADILYDQGHVKERRSLHLHYYAIKQAALSFAENNIEYIDALPAKLIIDVLLNYQEQNPPEMIAKAVSRLQGVYTKPQFIGVLKNSRYVFVDLMRLLVLFMEERVEVIERTSPGLIDALENLMPSLLPLMLMPPEVVDQKIKQNADKARGRKYQMSYTHYRAVQDFEDKALEMTRARFGDRGLTSLQTFQSTPDSLLNEARINKTRGKQLVEDEENGMVDWDPSFQQMERQQNVQPNYMDLKNDQFNVEMPIAPQSNNRDQAAPEKMYELNTNSQTSNANKHTPNESLQQRQILFNDFDVKKQSKEDAQVQKERQQITSFNEQDEKKQSIQDEKKQSIQDKKKQNEEKSANSKKQQPNQNKQKQQQSSLSEEPLEAFWQIMEGTQIEPDENLNKKQKRNKSKAIEILERWDMWEDKQQPNDREFKNQNVLNSKVMRFQNQQHQQVRTNSPLDDWEKRSQFELPNDDDSVDDQDFSGVRILHRNPQQIEQLKQRKQQFQKQQKNNKNQRGKGNKFRGNQKRRNNT